MQYISLSRDFSSFHIVCDLCDLKMHRLLLVALSSVRIMRSHALQLFQLRYIISVYFPSHLSTHLIQRQLVPTTRVSFLTLHALPTVRSCGSRVFGNRLAAAIACWRRSGNIFSAAIFLYFGLNLNCLCWLQQQREKKKCFSSVWRPFGKDTHYRNMQLVALKSFSLLYAFKVMLIGS